MSWTQFGAVLLAFFVTHSVPVRPPIRAAFVRGVGERGFTVFYSALSLVMFAAVIMAAGRAPFVLLWPQAPWQHLVVIAGMLVVCFILAFSIGRPNPFSFGGARNRQFDPAHPGIVRWMRHPVLIALLLWSLLHLLPNGDLAHVIVFGMFSVFAAFGTTLIDRRKQRIMGKDPWCSLLLDVGKGRFVPQPANWAGVVLRTVFALAGYGTLFVLHPILIGVPIWD